ncbi:ProQ/FINO family protein [Rhizobium leguminosarum]|uniref:ProQ/FINO family protein n=1 Tax=Rhizobium leguminosarum TaxID=384 RepID=UPI002E137584|nr:ProQ/FINO family protein [Rhizobium leguminosarum]
MGDRNGVDAELWDMVDLVCQKFPKAFAHPRLQGRGMAPLSLSIGDDLKAAMPEADPRLIDRFLSFYVTRFWYYRCLTAAAAPRVRLDGSLVGRVTVAEADEAQAHHDRMLKTRKRRPPSETCEGSGKTIYASGGAALAAASRVRRNLGDRQETSVYRCSHCGRFHWGHYLEQQPAGDRLAVVNGAAAMKHSKRHIETLMRGD